MPPIVCQLPVEAVECSNQWRERMSSFSSGVGQPSYYSQQYRQHHQQQPIWSLNDLSTELLTLIFQQVRLPMILQQRLCLLDYATHQSSAVGLLEEETDRGRSFETSTLNILLQLDCFAGGLTR